MLSQERTADVIFSFGDSGIIESIQLISGNRSNESPRPAEVALEVHSDDSLTVSWQGRVGRERTEIYVESSKLHVSGEWEDGRTKNGLILVDGCEWTSYLDPSPSSPIGYQIREDGGTYTWSSPHTPLVNRFTLADGPQTVTEFARGMETGDLSELRIAQLANGTTVLEMPQTTASELFSFRFDVAGSVPRLTIENAIINYYVLSSWLSGGEIFVLPWLLSEVTGCRD